MKNKIFYLVFFGVILALSRIIPHPPNFTPISENLLTEKFVCDCKIVISCGRKSVIPSAALKKRFGNEKILTKLYMVS